jgi:flavorubredoxin
MRTFVVYETEHGNTEKVARAIADALSVHGSAVPVEKIGTLDAGRVELMAVGATTQRRGLLRAMRGLLGGAPEGAFTSETQLLAAEQDRDSREIYGTGRMR